MSLCKMGKRAKDASFLLGVSSENLRNKALLSAANALCIHSDEIIKENKKDIDNAIESGLNKSLLDRLKLDDTRIKGMAKAIEDICALPDPLGRTIDGFSRPNGLHIEKITVPLGVIGIIYEARPNVTSDAAALCIKSGNAVILRGGKEAINSNIAVGKVLSDALEQAGLPKNSVQVVEDTSRDSAHEMMAMTEYLDLLIPRGGKGLISSVVENSKVPVIETGTGNCHVYVEKTADLNMAKDIIYNAKVSRPSVCNACESILVDSDIAEEFLPIIDKELKKAEVTVHGCEKTCRIIPDAIPASDKDYGTEYLGYEISCKVVSGVDEAIMHINKYGTGHSESIVTKDYFAGKKFQTRVDAAAVYINASTRFTDGGEFGFGGEIGISTQKIHARGPMGIKELTSYKYIINGDGQIR